MTERVFYAKNTPLIGLAETSNEGEVEKLLSRIPEGEPVYEVIVRERYDLSNGVELWSFRITKGRLIRAFKTVGRKRPPQIDEWTNMQTLRADFVPGGTGREALNLALRLWNSKGFVMAERLDTDKLYAKLEKELSGGVRTYYEGYVDSGEASRD